ncbi:hypothetical protein ADK76_02370 [Streptomyces griseoflavus]|uniref:DUF4188 domain-containing protein n=1 Tax=Streptomyces rimosus TaxID=1927 RepID=UPI0004C48722|nr:DUF4188 domain-containing protein [Streptomyces rimosus]KOG66423.1 hypothetical protein ADK76_02370 [Streptomyces griseoflavus]
MGNKVVPGRMRADVGGEVVVFMIGMRINRLRAVGSWLPTVLAMPPMLKELASDRESGLLGYRALGGGPRVFGVVQYWESREKLYAYASDPDKEHRPAWAAFNRRARDGKGSVGIWHETYVVPAGAYSTLYNCMPPTGLGAAHGVVTLGRSGARSVSVAAA